MIRYLAIFLLLGACAHEQERRPILAPVTLETRVTVHIVPGPEFMPERCRQIALKQGGGLAGCAPVAEIWVVGYQTPDGIAVRPWPMVHESLHVFHWIDGRVADPDGGR